MKVPLSWLNDYVELGDLSVQELSDRLTFSGVEVEGIESSGASVDDHFVVGEILSAEQHPNADKLRVCRVSDGAQEYQIVCGAPNARPGIKIPLARIGAKVPHGGFEIKKAKLRGVESFGMLCSRSELNVPGDSDGLWELPVETPAGTPVSQFMPKPDTVFDLEITWNRPDCLSIIGIAREFAALLGRPLKLPAVDFAETGPAVDTLAKVRVEAPDKCLRYTARVVTGLDPNAPVPGFMRERLEKAGQRSLGLAVDVTNYVMLECGQPLHAFDHTRLVDRTIVVRCAEPGEKITTLDGTQRTLDASMLVIADAKNPEAVAGIMGGAQSEIAAATGTVLIESALFEPANVKRTATALGLGSESSRRFERGVDPELADWASRRAVHLLATYGGPAVTVAQGMIDVDARPPRTDRLALNLDRVREVIGVALTNEKIVSILVSLGLTVASQTAEEVVFAIPSYRLDLTRQADLIEEVARMNGLDAIPDRMPSLSAVSTLCDKPFKHRAFCRRTMLGLGFTEAMHYSFLSAQELDLFDARDAANRLALPNPVSADYGVMRPSLLPQMLGSLGRNASRQVEFCGLFEMGRVFGKSADGAPLEEERLSIGLLGPFGRGPVDRQKAVTNEEALLWMKGAVENLTKTLRAGRLTFVNCEHPAAEPGFAVEISLNGAVVGILAAVSAGIRHRWRLTSPMVVAELKLAPLLAGVGSVRTVQAPPQFPSVRRDIAFTADASVTHAAVVAAIRRNAPKELAEIELFDVFASKQLGEGRRSLAYALQFRSGERTLTDAEVNAAFAAIVKGLKEVPGIEVREG